jgi:hypothetical protein
MGIKIHLTESQMKYALNEISLDGDEALNANNGNMQQATREVMANAKSSGVNTDNGGVNVSYSSDALRKNGINEKDMKSFTKKEIDEMRRKNLSKTSKKFTKKGLMEKLMKESKKAYIYDTILESGTSEEEARKFLCESAWGNCPSSLERMPSGSKYVGSFEGTDMYYNGNSDNYFFVNAEA